MKKLSLLSIGLLASCLPFSATLADHYPGHYYSSGKMYSCPNLTAGKTYYYGEKMRDANGSGYWYLWTQYCNKCITVPSNFRWTLFQVRHDPTRNYVQLFCTANPLPYWGILVSTNIRVYGANSCSSNNDGTFTCH